MNGWLILDKPLGLGSTQGVSAVKRALTAGGYAKCKVGHGGTLDPLATGVLPIALGEATKLAGRMLDASKVYAFTIGFGSETETLDAEGEVSATSDVRPTFAEIEAVLPRFTGPIEQIPPKYSALKIDGKRAYDLARAGVEVEMKTRRVTIESLTVSPEPVDGRLSDENRASTSSALTEDGSSEDRRVLESITLLAHVSKGTYIRSLARDIARALDTVGHVTMLRRLRAGPFALDSAISLDRLAELGQGAALEEALLPIEAGLDDIPALTLTPGEAEAVRQGRFLSGIAADDGLTWARGPDGIPVALVQIEGGELRIVRGFNL
ncbi:tRNA pseudouridine(55) synthase TruB [Novosphingopyxis sp. YJ-S2-01]|uniref:tRNA pseudouridine(55) synthase TruB n=1 Tax=Novosphingopyxis sp. YJ-S2-01 TaxID=2794021 RepID=UPI0018DC21CC|nr:tRNA pseudouridine(55) synthase TruB [Novosphingopyxis sp. YJ-S2-01]